MVDAVVSLAIDRLGNFLIQEAAFGQNVRKNVESLQAELKMMQSYLKDAEEKKGGDNRLDELISQIRDVALESEDVIDTFLLKVEEEGTRKRKRGLVDSAKNIVMRIIGIDHYNISKKIEELKERLVEISRRRDRYGIVSLGNDGTGTGRGAIGNLRQLRRTSPFEDEELAIGFEDVTTSLANELLKEEPRRWVISILGMGGLGKTTLARKLYHHREVKGKFKHQAWVCVSQEYRIPDILQRIIKSFKPDNSREEFEMLEKMAEEDLERHLREFLEGRRYLVVIDDVWHIEAWEILRRAFPDNSNGSRVIITTRNKAVAERSDDKTHVHELRFLRSDESWELFCKNAFPNHNASGGDTTRCPPSLQMLGSEMVEKCRGLPLAIIVLGGVLSRKQPHEWQTVKKHIWRDLKNDSIHISQILALSFNDLPCQLKPCFLYFGLFPEDFEINTEKLIRLWVAEGFIPLGEETLEEVAEDWLNELIGRSLVQVAKRSWMRITTCRIHDLLRDLAVKKAKELNFLHIYDGSSNSTPSSTTASAYRRQAAHSSIERYVSVDYSNPCLRTLLFFNPDAHYYTPSKKQSLTLIHTRFRLLRVLDLHGIRFELREDECSFPDAIGELIHLRYLGLGYTQITKLPSSIVNLQALQTLNALPSKVFMKLPGDICKLKQLRHLIGRFQGHLAVEHLTNLQTLKFVDLDDWMKINPMNFTNLRELRIWSCGGSEQKFTWDPFANLINLQSLSVNLCSPMYFPSIQPLSHCRHLLQLMISGRIEILPEQMHEYLPNLKYLMLRNSQLMQDPMPTLEKLPNLTILELRDDNLKKLTCTAKGFPRLEALVLENLCLEELQVEEGSMPMLKGLQINLCNEFPVRKRLPNYLNWDWDWVTEHWRVGIMGEILQCNCEKLQCNLRGITGQ